MGTASNPGHFSGEAAGLVAVEDDGAEKGVDPGISEAQSGRSLTVDDLGSGEVVEDAFTEDRVVAHALDAEEASVGGEADLPQGGEVLQPFADPEVAGVGDGGFRPQRSLFLGVLLD